MYSSIALSVFTLCTARHLQNIFIFPHWISTSIKHQFPTLLPSNFWQPLFIFFLYDFDYSTCFMWVEYYIWPFVTDSCNLVEHFQGLSMMKLVSMLYLFCCCAVTQSCLTLCNPMDCSTPGFSVLHHLPYVQTHVHWAGGAIQQSNSLSSPSTFNLSQHQSLFQWDYSSHQVAKVLEF